MARFDKLDTSNIELLNKKKCFLVKGTLTLDDVNKLNGLTRKIVLVLDNTKGQSSDVISYLRPDIVRICVVGGLDFFHKQKYNNEEFVRRTIYTPKNIANIMKVFEGIERKIMYSWTDSQKCMYVYKTLCEMFNPTDGMEFEIQNGSNIISSLNSLLYGRCDDEGLSLAYKEAMDRLGIECHYQSIDGIHSFNAVKFDGQYHTLDLYWDIKNRNDFNKCGFNYFCREDGNKFYSNKYHDLSSEKDEVRYPSVSITDQKLQEDLTTITTNKKEFSHEMTKYTNSLGENFDYTCLGESAGLYVYIVRQNDNINYFYADKNANIEELLSNDNLSAACYKDHNLSSQTLPLDVKRFSRYIREDGTNFVVCPTGRVVMDNIFEYSLLEPLEVDGKKVLKKTIVLTENNLIDETSNGFRQLLSNYLLSKKRIEERVVNFNGYMGFATYNTRSLFEREKYEDSIKEEMREENIKSA